MSNPLDDLSFPVYCDYVGCGTGPFTNGDQVDEHISEDHGPEVVWHFADDFLKPRADRAEDSRRRDDAR